MRTAIIIAAAALAGCGQYPSAGSQPRALLWGAGQPSCAFWCNIQVSVTNAEGDSAVGSTGTTQSKTLSTKQRSSMTYAPPPPPAQQQPAQ